MTKAYCECHRGIVEYTQPYGLCNITGQAAHFRKINKPLFKIYCKNCKTESIIDENSTGCPHCNSWINLKYLDNNESVKFISSLKELYIQAIINNDFEKEFEDIKSSICQSIVTSQIVAYSKSYGTNYNEAKLLLMGDRFKNEGFTVKIESCGNGKALTLSGWGLSDK